MWNRLKFYLGIVFWVQSLIINLTFGQEVSFELDLSSISVTHSQAEILRGFVHEVESLIPESMKNGLPQSVRIHFKPLSHHQKLLLPYCANDESSESAFQGVDVYGQVRGDGVIELNSLFIPEILAGLEGSSSYPCGHQKGYRLAQGTLIHELAHVYDRSYSFWGNRVVSSDRRYQRLAGWKKVNQGVRSILKPLNTLRARSPDPYEFQSIEENFAVNLEYFLLDLEYGFRRPALYGYLVEHFAGFVPYSLPEIKPTLFKHTKSGGIDPHTQVRLDPDRIYQIHSLLAAPMGPYLSRYGHSMFRLVVCAPERTVVGPDCLKDIQHHLVLSYNAYVEQAQLNSWKGLRGGYTTQAFLFPLTEVIEYYTKIDQRDLTSIPIRLNVMEKHRLIDRILEQYWEYQSQYFLISNNCSVEAGHLLKGVLGDELRGFKGSTPIALEEKLKKIGRLEEGVLRDRKEAIRLGYIFPSIRKTLEDSFSNLQKQIKGFHWENLESYMSSSKAVDRIALIQAVVEQRQNGVEGLAPVLASFYLIESYLELKFSQNISAQAFSEIERQAKQGRDLFFQEAHQASLNQLRASLPASLLVSGYGVALESDFRKEDPSLDTLRWRESEARIKEWMEKRYSTAIREIRSIQANKKVLLSQMTKRTMH